MLGPRVDQDCLYLYLASQALEFRVLSERRSGVVEAHGVVDRLVALVRVFLGGMMNSRLLPVELEILREVYITAVFDLRRISLYTMDHNSCRLRSKIRR